MSSPRGTCPLGRSTITLLLGAALLSVPWLEACGPKFEDVYGSGMRAILWAPIENGWVAVDSTEEGATRAVLQLEDEAERGTLPWDLAELALLLDHDTIAPSLMRSEESAVCRRVQRPVRTPNERAVAEPPDRTEEEVVVCDHVVRAEFVLPALPSPADTVLLHLGATTIHLRWR